MNVRNDNRKDLRNIIEVKELNLICDVNTHIKLGWKLIDTYKEPSIQQGQAIKYCMGLPKSASITRPPLNKSSKIDPEVARKFVYSV